MGQGAPCSFGEILDFLSSEMPFPAQCPAKNAQLKIKNLKCYTMTPCMTGETFSLIGSSLGHQSLDVRVDVPRLQLTAVSLSQGRSKLDNWGADIHIFVFCTINFL